MNNCDRARVVFYNDFLSHAEPGQQCGKAVGRFQFGDVDHVLGHAQLFISCVKHTTKCDNAYCRPLPLLEQPQVCLL